MSPPLPSIPVQQLAAIGPYFALGATGADSQGWLPASSLIQDAEHLGQVIDEVAARLGTTQRWIAASVFYQGWAARLTSIYAGSAVLCGAVPDLRADLVRYRPRRSGPVDLSVVQLQPLRTDAGWRHLHDGHLAPLAAAVRGRVRIGGYLLRGNAAAALAGALGVLAQARPEPLDALIGHGWAQPANLASCGRWVPGADGPRYARATCCGYEQLEQGGRCGDCSLNWRPFVGPSGWRRA
jgi:hypothetical protein